MKLPATILQMMSDGLSKNHHWNRAQMSMYRRSVVILIGGKYRGTSKTDGEKDKMDGHFDG